MRSRLVLLAPLTLGAGLLSLSASPSFADNETNPVESILARSLPADRDVPMSYSVNSTLEDFPIGFQAEGTFHGRERVLFDLVAKRWPRRRLAHFVVGRDRVCFREEGAPEGAASGWTLFDRQTESEREPAYRTLEVPPAFLARLVPLAESMKETGKRTIGILPCVEYQADLPPETAISIAHIFGFEAKSGTRVTASGGKFSFWVDTRDSLLRQVRLSIEIEVEVEEDPETGQQTTKHAPPAEEWTWESGSSRGGIRSVPAGPDGSPPPGVGGADSPTSSGKKRERKALTMTLGLDPTWSDDRIGESGGEIERVEPDPEAARLVDW